MKITEFKNLWVVEYKPDGRNVLVVADNEGAAVWTAGFRFGVLPSNGYPPRGAVARLMENASAHRFSDADFSIEFDCDKVGFCSGTFC